MRGRKPAPAHLRAISGGKATSHRPENDGKPARDALTASAPDKPEEVAAIDDASRVWDRLMPQLVKAGLSASEFEVVLVKLAVNYGLYLKTLREWWEDGGVQLVKTPNGYPVQHPAIALKNKYLRLATEAASELGLSPTALTRAERLDQQADLFGGDDMAGLID